MIKSKIPLPSKRTAQSSIPLPTKSLGTQSKKLPLNSKEALVSKKPVSTKQVPSISSKVGEKEKNIVKRLPSSKACDSKKVAVLSKKPSCNGKKVADTKSKLTENKLIKQTKPVPVRPPIVSKPRSVTNKENQPNRLSSYKSHIGKTAVPSYNEPKTIKSAMQSKAVNQAKYLNKISTNGLKENSNKNPLVKKKEEIVAVVAPFEQLNLASNSGVDDSEFQKSGFFKSLILNERELSPGLIKHCSGAEFSPSKANLLQPPQKVHSRFLTADEFVQEVKRVSAKYHRVNGRLVLNSPYMPNRRWTCNVSSKPSIASMSTTEIGAELRRISEIRRESGAQLYKKTTFLEHQYSVEKLNPAQRALKELEFLSARKRDKMKKKVTFFIPSPGSPDLTSTSTKPEAKLSDISEGSSHTSTPELDLGNGRIMTNSQSGGSVENVEDTSVITTPELNLTTYKLEFVLSPKELNETLPFDLSRKNDASTNNCTSNNQVATLEAVKDVTKKNSEQGSQNLSLNSTNLKPDFISSKFSSLKINENNVCVSHDIPDSNSTSFENYLTNTNSNSYIEFSNIKSTDCLFQSANRLAVPTIYQPVNETERFYVNTERFCVNTEKNIFTPHPVKLQSKSNLPHSVSPLLPRKFLTLNSTAPICTPFVLKTLSHSPEINLSPVRQRLEFNERPNNFMERRESQIILQSIPTAQKINDFLCDQECIILSSQSSEEEVFFRNLINPIASTLNNGDEMHFIPINSQ